MGMVTFGGCLSVQETIFRSRSKLARPYMSRLRCLSVTWNPSAAAGQGEPGGDGLLVAADAAGEGAQSGQVAGLDGGEPVLECEQALAAGDDGGEGAGRRCARRRGHASAMLAAALPVAHELGIDPALVTCDEDNIASRKVIEANGGVLDDKYGVKLRFWVATS